jgi:HK97 family phage major capsid protein
MKVTRRSLKQSGAALEAAVRRDMNGAIGEAMDRAVFLGTGADGQPTGIITLAEDASPSVITVTPVDAAASWAAFRAAVTRFMVANAANSPRAVRLDAAARGVGFHG